MRTARDLLYRRDGGSDLHIDVAVVLANLVRVVRYISTCCPRWIPDLCTTDHHHVGGRMGIHRLGKIVSATKV